MTVIFKDIRKTATISLPSFEGSEVELYDDLLFGQMKQVNEAKCGDLDRGVLVLQFLIKGWNFTDESGKVLEITPETLNAFPVKDFTILMDRVTLSLEAISKKNEKPSKEQL